MCSGQRTSNSGRRPRAHGSGVPPLPWPKPQHRWRRPRHWRPPRRRLQRRRQHLPPSRRALRCLGTCKPLLLRCCPHLLRRHGRSSRSSPRSDGHGRGRRHQRRSNRTAPATRQRPLPLRRQPLRTAPGSQAVVAVAARRCGWCGVGDVCCGSPPRLAPPFGPPPLRLQPPRRQLRARVRGQDERRRKLLVPLPRRPQLRRAPCRRKPPGPAPARELPAAAAAAAAGTLLPASARFAWMRPWTRSSFHAATWPRAMLAARSC
mmetsp:Transcript_135646/g.338403  ORF Transcript_135646/g.338403 Transcript_135646/m.338403 type:complete len:262 (-) Transcript_135646:178-963(-)